MLCENTLKISHFTLSQKLERIVKIESMIFNPIKLFFGNFSYE